VLEARIPSRRPEARRRRDLRIVWDKVFSFDFNP
jgi:hypothetical protein